MDHRGVAHSDLAGQNPRQSSRHRHHRHPPEDITRTAQSPGDIRLNAIVDAVELVGSESLLYARAPGYAKDLVLHVQGTHAGKPGAAITLHVPLASIRPFHKEPGRRI